MASLGGYAEVFQRNVLASGVDPADQPDHGPVRRRRGLFAGDDRLHLHGEGQLLHVRHRPRRGQDRDPRGRDAGGAGRRGHPHHASPASPTSPSRTTSRRCCRLRAFFDFLPLEQPRRAARAADRDDPATAIEDSLDTLVPANPNQPYDMQELIRKVVDEGDFFEVQPAHAGNIVIGFGRIDGRTVGIVANQPMVLAGVPRHRRVAARPRASCASATPSTSRS